MSQSVSRPPRHIASHGVPDSQRDRLVHRPHGNDTGSALVRRKLQLLFSCFGGLFAPAKLAAIGSHPMQDHRQLARHRDAGARHASALGHVHAPCPQRRPFGAADQQRMGCLVQRHSGHFVTTSADAALQVGFAGLVASRRQAKMRADIARPSEAVRLVDRGTERQRRQRADARHCHQPPACRLHAHLLEHAPGQPLHLPGQFSAQINTYDRTKLLDKAAFLDFVVEIIRRINAEPSPLTPTLETLGFVRR